MIQRLFPDYWDTTGWVEQRPFWWMPKQMMCMGVLVDAVAHLILSSSSDHKGHWQAQDSHERVPLASGSQCRKPPLCESVSSVYQACWDPFTRQNDGDIHLFLEAIRRLCLLAPHCFHSIFFFTWQWPGNNKETDLNTYTKNNEAPY